MNRRWTQPQPGAQPDISTSIFKPCNHKTWKHTIFREEGIDLVNGIPHLELILRCQYLHILQKTHVGSHLWGIFLEIFSCTFTVPLQQLWLRLCVCFREAEVTAEKFEVLDFRKAHGESEDFSSTSFFLSKINCWKFWSLNFSFSLSSPGTSIIKLQTHFKGLAYCLFNLPATVLHRRWHILMYSSVSTGWTHGICFFQNSSINVLKSLL